MCRACVSPLIAHPALFDQPLGFAGLQLAPSRRGFMALSTAALLGSGLSMVGAGHARAAAATAGAVDTIFRNGTIVPIADVPSAEAIALSGGKIVKLGKADDVMSMATKDTQVIDLAGRTLLPGLIDPHNHTVLSSLYLELLTDVGYLKNRTRADLINNLRQLASNTPEGQWVMVSNFDNLLQGGDLSREELDSVSTTRAIFVWYTNGHDAAVNSLALKLANIPEDVGTLPGGGHFGRGPDGKLNGLVYEVSAMLKVVSVGLPKITPQLAYKAINQFMQAAAATGNTLLHEPGTLRSEWIAPFTKIAAHAPLRTSASLMFEDVKGFEPYLDDSSAGEPNFTADQMKQMVAEVKAAGLPVLIHCNGDRTIDIALDAIEAGYGSSTEFGINRIEHSTMVRPDQIARMKTLNVEPSFLMNHVTLYGAAYRDQLFGPERAAFMDPAGACVKENIRFTLHTDSPCSPLGSLGLVQTAVTRVCEFDNSVIGADQAVTVQRALEAVTIDAARQLGLADRLGSLEAGKEADFTILEDNPLTVDPAKIGQIKVSETWVNGEKKFG